MSEQTMPSFPFYKQQSAMDCGPTCLRMIFKYYGRHFTIENLKKKTEINKQGVSLLAVSDTAEQNGFRTRATKLTIQKLTQVPTPCILFWEHNHFVVLVSISKKIGKINSIKVADPRIGFITYSFNEFSSKWCSTISSNGEEKGIALLLEPTSTFYELKGDPVQKVSWNIFFRYIKGSKWPLFRVFFAMIIGALFQLIFPFLTQSIIDTGINSKNLQFIIVVLSAQLTLTLSGTIIELIKNRILLRVANIFNLQILSDFWIKLTKLPISYFDVHQTGDTLQRINDHKQIQSFLTGSSVTALFSIVTFLIYSIVLVIYNPTLFLIFLGFSFIYFLWTISFLKIRRRVNHETFQISARENAVTLQLVQGMQDIRLNDAERKRRWEWENLQSKIFNLNFKTLNYDQLQSIGGIFISRLQEIIISFIVARLVIEGELTLGAMLAIQYVIGQLAVPIQLWATFIQNVQDAKMSVERLNEIHQLPDEVTKSEQYFNILPKSKSICVENLTFIYPGTNNKRVLDNLTFVIPENKTTAVVGASGSGKTTLIKILLRIYSEYSGEIRIGKDSNEMSDNCSEPSVNLRMIDPRFWRRKCGSVLQDGYIFNSNIAENIVMSDDPLNLMQLLKSANLANILPFIESLPNSFYTQLGADGVGISQGQKQRILIARAVYKNPEYLFFDEATSSLDANNEKEIVKNLKEFFSGKTVLIAAHRLSTVKEADNIIVLDQGRIVEQGNHEHLIGLKGKYFELVKNQLELGN